MPYGDYRPQNVYIGDVPWQWRPDWYHPTVPYQPWYVPVAPKVPQCPNCGRCPHCGQPQAPIRPYMKPYWGTITVSNTSGG